ncbi:MAG: GGDEF domain-containing protein [Gemmatimonadales bacterium]
MTRPRESGAFGALNPPTRIQRLKAFFARPDDFLIDAGKAGELLIAKIRLGLTLLLMTIPLGSLALAPAAEREQHLTGFFITLFAVAVAALVYLMVARDRRQRWLPTATSIMDVALITFALLIYALTVDPLQAVNSLVTFDTYFLAIAATCLRYDRRVALVAGLAAIVFYGGIILLVGAGLGGLGDTTRYGQFLWSDQVSRLVNLAVATAVAVYIVQSMQRQRELSTADPLTGIFNRRFFDDYFGNEIARANRYHVPAAVAMIDVDHFKRFNDVYGHATGDRALKTVARALQKAVRRSDLVARYGGEEFVVVFRNTDADQALDRVEAIRRAIEAVPLLVAGTDGPAKITVSAGLASWPADGLTAEELLGRADERLFQAKDSGRNRVVGPPPAAPEAAIGPI